MAYISPQHRGSFARQPFRLQRGLVFGLILIAALGAFELFNYATTEYALATLIGGAQVLGVHWASVLAIAFCGIDFAGLARLFTPEQGRDEPKEIWYLTGAWFLGAAMNAVMTWWAVTNALLGVYPLGNEVINRATLLTVVPIFVAALVWITRILIIGTISIAGERIFTLGARQIGRGGFFNAQRMRAPVSATSPAPAPRPAAPAYRQASTWPPYSTARPASTGAPAYSTSTAAPAASTPPRDDDELTYEPVDEERPTAVPNWPGARTGYERGQPRPAPKPGLGTAYSMRAYGREMQLYANRPATPRLYYAPSPDDKPDDQNLRFYR